MGPDPEFLDPDFCRSGSGHRKKRPIQIRTKEPDPKHCNKDTWAMGIEHYSYLRRQRVQEILKRSLDNNSQLYVI